MQLIISAVIVSMAAAVVTNASIVGTNDWPQELQGPTLHGLKPEIYAIWHFNEIGTDVCYPNVWYIRQLSGCTQW